MKLLNLALAGITLGAFLMATDVQAKGASHPHHAAPHHAPPHHGPGPAKHVGPVVHGHPAPVVAAHHPGRNEVLRRDHHEVGRVDKALAHDKLTHQQGTKLQGQLKTIRQQERQYAAKDHGHLKPNEKRVLNIEENDVKKEIRADERKDGRHPDEGNFAKQHPRRAEVLGRDNHQTKQIDNLEGKKKITYQQASHLKSQENHIRHQEQADAHRNGGYITKGQQKQMNREENHVEHEVKSDERKDAGH